jgi:AraC-like DNA-binding protein
MRLGTFPKSSDTPLPLWPPLLATRGAGGKSDRHVHHAMHVILAIDGWLQVRAADAPERSTFGVVTAPDAPHAIDARGLEVLLVFLDPESTAGAALLPAMHETTRLFSASERDSLLVDATPLAIMTTNFGEAWARRVVSVLGGNALPQRMSVHPKVKRALRLLRETTPGDDPSLESLAELVGLSPGRFMHAFTESVGIPLRPYLLWLKAQRAAGAIVGGEPLAAAAVGAGFADAAHMSRTFRRMFGVAPSELRKMPQEPKPGAS